MHAGDNCWHCYRLHYPRRPAQPSIWSASSRLWAKRRGGLCSPGLCASSGYSSLWYRTEYNWTLLYYFIPQGAAVESCRAEMGTLYLMRTMPWCVFDMLPTGRRHELWPSRLRRNGDLHDWPMPRTLLGIYGRQSMLISPLKPRPSCPYWMPNALHSLHRPGSIPGALGYHRSLLIYITQ